MGFIPQSLVLRTTVLGWILIYRNWSIWTGREWRFWGEGFLWAWNKQSQFERHIYEVLTHKDLLERTERSVGEQSYRRNWGKTNNLREWCFLQHFGNIVSRLSQVTTVPCHAGSIDWNFCQYNEILFSTKTLYFNFSQGAIFVSFQTREGQLLCCKCLVRFYLKNIALNLSFKTVWNELKSMTVVLV